jgi:uncharacterized membrane protein
MLVDAAIVMESFAVALLFRFNGHVPSEFWSTFWVFAVFAALAFVVLLYQSGVYQSTLRYRGIYQDVSEAPTEEALVVPRWMFRVASAASIATGGLFIAGFAVGAFVLGLRPVPLSVILIGALLAYMQLVAVRLLPRVFSTS